MADFWAVAGSSPYRSLLRYKGWRWLRKIFAIGPRGLSQGLSSLSGTVSKLLGCVSEKKKKVEKWGRLAICFDVASRRHSITLWDNKCS
jgi:hypothetical protein